jgi:hypothetical protein
MEETSAFSLLGDQSRKSRTAKRWCWGSGKKVVLAVLVVYVLCLSMYAGKKTLKSLELSMERASADELIMTMADPHLQASLPVNSNVFPPKNCPDLPKAPANHTIAAKHPHARPHELDNLLSIRNMTMPAAHSITGLHIAFVGDSLTRYMSMALSFYLRFGEWISDKSNPNILSHKAFQSWDAWADYAIDNVFGASHYPCDCYRANITYNRKTAGFYDNRYYRDSCRDNHVAFIARMGMQAFKGHWEPNESFESPAVYNQYVQSSEPLWEYDNYPDVLRNYIVKLVPKPDYLVINEGLWFNHTFTPVKEDDGDDQNGTTTSVSVLFHEIRQILDHHGIHGIYKTTTTGKRSADATMLPHDKIGCKILHSCLQMNWTAAIRGPGDYMDIVHFKPHANRWMVEQLWDHLFGLAHHQK